ncbi:DExH-box ATP-dependent RNA helicase DExH8 isoform X2 [Cryptomeria japonica]|uniref:DExH-box ATP-dependent RNA helicase DExH8 isoform X2 n=1 Tax=Cryptomeria japonica TaxID=3369 RepID=UPI0027DA01A5|nr:DExH-box ATP-dependent RNA helicase DExH8 isoform X2 [Cryptomeria japonica]
MATSSSAATSSMDFESLPVRMRKDHIVDKVKMNRVTLIVADTGSGKSSQVPQILLEEGYEPILCTQPRRLAVVAISKMVAELRGCELGEEVGCQIGQLKVITNRSKIIFKTAGVFLEELRGEGLAGILRYKVVVLDEVHERSVESDLLLTCIKQFMLRNNKIRLVLMSATADITRYRDYFRNLGKDERVEVIALPNSIMQRTPFQFKVMYLEQVVELLGRNPEHLSVLESFQDGCHEVDMTDGTQYLIRDLVMHIHNQDQDIKNSILIFLPTYRTLEQQWLFLKCTGVSLKIHVLHSSIDIEEATRAMQICDSYRKVILATNIAESSVTIPGLRYVIDSCRSLEIFWNRSIKKDVSRLVWVSKSQADQRKGRTGRTCDGEVFRLVSRLVYDRFDKYETPAMQKLSLRKQVIMINCAESKAINDPKVLFQKALDPPPQETVEDATDTLVSIGALKVSSDHRQKVEPTLYGRLLGSLPLSLEASMLVVKFGQCGFLREGAVIGSLMDSRPMPIVQPFGEKSLFNSYVECYYKDESGSSGTTQNETILTANLCAVQFWQRVFKDKHRLERLKEVAGNRNSTRKAHGFASLTSKLEQEWSSFHHLVQSALHSAAETYEVVMGIMHRFRPNFLYLLNGPPDYYNEYEFQHTCILAPGKIEGNLSTFSVDPETAGDMCIDVCVAEPYVDSEYFSSHQVRDELTTLIKEIRAQCTQPNSANTEEAYGCQPTSATPVCKFFVKGMCNRGDNCLFSHSYYAKPEICKKYLTLEGCRYGDACWFSHDVQASEVPEYREHVEFEDEIPSATSLLNLLPETGEDNQKYILVFGESPFCFALSLALHYDPSKIVVITMDSKLEAIKNSLMCTQTNELYDMGAQIIWDIHPFQFIKDASIPWSELKCILWTLTHFGKDTELETQINLLKSFFEFLAIKLLAQVLCNVQVERMARDSFFFLASSIAFDNSSFACFPTNKEKEKDVPPAKPISYIFELHPPSDILFGDYFSSLEKAIKM